jgi:hypothetical protein
VERPLAKRAAQSKDAKQSRRAVKGIASSAYGLLAMTIKLDNSVIAISL